MPKRYIEVSDPSPFGEQFDQAVLQDSGKDSTYIEGYSNVRTQRELAVARGERPEPLRHRLHWARGKTLDGVRDDGRRISHWQVNKHYRMLPYEEAVKLGYDVTANPAIRKGEDGLAWLGERVLMVADAPIAAANLKKVQQDTTAMLEAPQTRMQDAVESYNARHPNAQTEAVFELESPGKRRK